MENFSLTQRRVIRIERGQSHVLKGGWNTSRLSYTDVPSVIFLLYCENLSGRHVILCLR